MSRLDQLSTPPRIPPVVAYGLATLLPALALLFQQSFREWIEPIPFVFFFLLVALVSWAGGWGPGFVCVGASTALGYYFLRTSPVSARAAGATPGAVLFLMVSTLITSLAALVRRERERAVRVRDSFIAIAAHELRSPVTAFQLQIQNLRRKFESGLAGGVQGLEEELRRQISALERQGARLARAVNDLLDASRITAGSLRLELAEVDLAAAVRETAGRFAYEIERCGSNVTVQAEGALVGRWDPVRIDQIVANLLSNALKYGEGRPIEISVGQAGDGAMLEVTDHGIGVAPRDRGRIFERFERAVPLSRFGGIGLGLWITRESVLALGGSIEVQGTPGAGSTFRVWLPAAGPTRRGKRTRGSAGRLFSSHRRSAENRSARA